MTSVGFRYALPLDRSNYGSRCEAVQKATCISTLHGSDRQVVAGGQQKLSRIKRKRCGGVCLVATRVLLEEGGVSWSIGRVPSATGLDVKKVGTGR